MVSSCHCPSVCQLGFSLLQRFKLDLSLISPARYDSVFKATGQVCIPSVRFSQYCLDREKVFNLKKEFRKKGLTKKNCIQ